MDREIPLEVRRRATIRRLSIAGLSLAAIVFTFAATVQWLRPSVARRDLRTAIVGTGDVEATVQASGIVVPEAEQVVSSPVEARVLQVHRRAGDTIRVGDELLTLDTSAARLDFDRLDERIAQKESEAARLRLQIEENIDNLRAALEQQKLDAEMLRLKAEQTAQLLGQGLVSEQEARLDQVAAKKIAIEVSQTEHKITRAIRSGEAQVASASMEVSILRKERTESARQLDLAMMRSDRAGVVTSIVQEVGTTVRRGDVLARVADLSSFRIVATVSDLYVPRLAADMRVNVRVDPKTVVHGTLTSIDPRIENGVARMHIALDADAHARLRNNLRVDAFVVTSRRPAVLQVQRGVLGQSPREDVYVVRGGRIVRIPVRWGGIGEDNIEVAEGLEPGDEVVISDLSDYEGMKELRLK